MLLKKLAFGFVGLLIIAGCAGKTVRKGKRISAKRTPKRPVATSPTPIPDAPVDDTEHATVGVYEGWEPGDPPKFLLRDQTGRVQSFLCVEGCPNFEGEESPLGRAVRVFWRKEKQNSVLYGIEIL